MPCTLSSCTQHKGLCLLLYTFTASFAAMCKAEGEQRFAVN